MLLLTISSLTAIGRLLHKQSQRITTALNDTNSIRMTHARRVDVIDLKNTIASLQHIEQTIMFIGTVGYPYIPLQTSSTSMLYTQFTTSVNHHEFYLLYDAKYQIGSERRIHTMRITTHFKSAINKRCTSGRHSQNIQWRVTVLLSAANAKPVALFVPRQDDLNNIWLRWRGRWFGWRAASTFIFYWGMDNRLTCKNIFNCIGIRHYILRERGGGGGREGRRERERREREGGGGEREYNIFNEKHAPGTGWEPQYGLLQINLTTRNH